jgi:hypothetical protein
MRTLLLLSLALMATSASATEKGQCDAKPFTLNKPAPAAQKAPPAPKVATAKPQTAQLKAKPAPKPKLVIGCKQPADKPAG